MPVAAAHVSLKLHSRSVLKPIPIDSPPGCPGGRAPAGGAGRVDDPLAPHADKGRVRAAQGGFQEQYHCRVLVRQCWKFWFSLNDQI